MKLVCVHCNKELNPEFYSMHEYCINCGERIRE
jgi:predicted RNA-binding Zn-ribbon protein involved in translation (DUF1610 family)